MEVQNEKDERRWDGELVGGGVNARANKIERISEMGGVPVRTTGFERAAILVDSVQLDLKIEDPAIQA